MTAIDARISLFAIEVQEKANNHFAKHFPALTVPTFTVDWGSRYAKVVRNHGDVACAVHSFVDRTNGDILKAATWNAPANHIRGSVLAKTTKARLKGLSVYGDDCLI